MTTNTYQALCNSVEAYYMTEGREYDSEGNICSWYKNYPEHYIVNNVNNGIAGTRPDALYALTQKLVDEGVLCKEKVKEALCLYFIC